MGGTSIDGKFKVDFLREVSWRKKPVHRMRVQRALHDVAAVLGIALLVLYASVSTDWRTLA